MLWEYRGRDDCSHMESRGRCLQITHTQQYLNWILEIKARSSLGRGQAFQAEGTAHAQAWRGETVGRGCTGPRVTRGVAGREAGPVN